MADHGIWMPIYWGDYLGKTSGLTCEEHGAYLLLICAYWQRRKALPDDDRYLSTATRLTRKKWKIIRPKIIEYFVLKDGELKHERVEFELLKSCQRISSAQARAYARWHPQDMQVTTTTTKKEDSFSFMVGSKAGVKNGHTIQDPRERLNRFQKTLAEAMGRDGYSIVGAAQDPQNPLYTRSLALCKAKAEELGKGWPHQWSK